MQSGGDTVGAKVEAALARSFDTLDLLRAGPLVSVYRAGRAAPAGPVVVKVVATGDVALEAVARAALEREIEIGASLHHPRLVPLLDAGHVLGRRFAVFPFLDGETLRARLDRVGRLSTPDAGQVMEQVLDALAFVHARGLVHRDVKPENILLSRGPNTTGVTLLDFGLARPIGTLVAPDATAGADGTPAYAAPEQLGPSAVTPQSDLYAWGLVLLECLTGRPPVDGTDPAAAVQWQLAAAPVALPAELLGTRLGRLCRDVTRKPLARRATDAASVLRELRDIMRGEPIAAAPAARPAVRPLPATAPMVGRDRQARTLAGAWRDACAGRSSVVVITGEAGIGKSRLLRELRTTLPPIAWLEARCTPDTQGSPLQPFIELVRKVSADIRVNGLARVAAAQPDAANALSELLGEPHDRAPLAVSPERRRELVLDGFVALFEAGTLNRALLLAIEDVHWADPTSMALLERLVARTRLTPVGRGGLMVVTTARPPFSPPWMVTDAVPIPLARLDQAGVAQLVAAAGLSAEVADDVLARSDGVPLFVEEIVAILANDAARGRWRSAAEPVTLPADLQGVLSARLDAVSGGARTTAQVAAALGRSFSYELLRAVVDGPDDALRSDLRELSGAGLLFARDQSDVDRWTFKHALVRDATYETIPAPAKPPIHARVATTLATAFPDVARERPELLAQHFERAGRIDDAVDYWKRSGDRTMAAGAYAESIRHFRRGVALLDAEPAAASDRRHRAVALLESLGTAQLSTLGYSSSEVDETFTRVQQLCDALGEAVPIRALHGVYGVRLSRGDRAQVERYLPAFRRIAERDRDAVSQLTAHGHLGLHAFLEGRFADACAAFARATPWYDTPQYRAFRDGYGYDGGLIPFSYLAWAQAIRGNAAAADAVLDDMRRLARASGNPYGRAISLSAAALVAITQRRPAAARDVAEELLVLAQRERLHLWSAYASCAKGWALAHDGDTAAAIALLDGGLGLFEAIGYRLSRPFHEALRGEALLRDGRPADARTALLAALDEATQGIDRSWVVRLWRLRADVERALAAPADAARSLAEATRLAAAQDAPALLDEGES